MNNSLEYICEINNFSRFFKVKWASYLFANIYLDIYTDLWILVINNNNELAIFLSNQWINKSLNDWLSFFTSDNKFINYKEKFQRFISESDLLFNWIIDRVTLNKKDIDEFYYLIISFFTFYRKTEFFYTDLAYKSNNVITQKNIWENEILKQEWRELLIKIFNWNNSFLNRFINKISNQYNNDLLLQNYKLLDILCDNRNIIYNDWIFYSYKWVIKDFSKEKRIYKKYFRNNYSKIIKWNTANKWYVIWIAKVINANFTNFDNLLDEIVKMKNGDILIAETTSPDLMLACNKASAIITNQWWIWSHAAIVSRELDIPCVVWTWNATILIKDWDKLEVDANNWIIKIL